MSYYNEIKDNQLGFEYYRDAYEFTTWVSNNLGNLNASKNGTKNSIKNSANYDEYDFTEIDDIFGDVNNNIEDKDSKFNQHRRDVIRAVIQTNLSAAIAGFSTYAANNVQFIMPKISEEDWDLLENNVCMATFLQGFTIGNKTYNNYSVVPNTLNKEYVDEDDICILNKSEKTYSKINDRSLNNDQINNSGYYSGVWKINLENREINDNWFIPVSYKKTETEYIPYLESYSSTMGSEIEEYNDIYKYMRNIATEKSKVKEAYYVALGRERKGSFKFTNYGD